MKFCSCYSNIGTENNYEKSNPIKKKITPQKILLRIGKLRLNFVSRPVLPRNHMYTTIPTPLWDEGLDFFAG